MLDLKALLTKMCNLLSLTNDWVQMTVPSGTTGNNTITKFTNLSIVGKRGKHFTTQSNQVTIIQHGLYIIDIQFRLNAVTTQGNVKRVSVYKNGSEWIAAMERVNSWEDVSVSYIRECQAGDILTAYRRFEDGNSTISYATIRIRPLEDY